MNWQKHAGWKKGRRDVLDECRAIRTKHAGLEKKKSLVSCEQCGDRASRIAEGKRLCAICFGVVAA